MNDMHLSQLDLTQIRLLAELSRFRNVSQAALRIGVSQSAGSHALAKLRRQLGDPLFTRTRDGFQPTPFGARVGSAATEALDVLLAGLTSSSEFNPRTASREFNFYANDVGQMVLFPSLLKFLKAKAPGVTVRVHPIPLDSPGAGLSSGEVDFAVGFFDNLMAGFRQTLVFRERFVCIARAGHPGVKRGMTVDAFKNAEHAVADPTGMAFHGVIERVLSRQGLRRNVKVRLPSLHVLPMIVANSDLLGVVPSRLAQAYAQILPVKVLPLPVATSSYDIRLHWHERYDHDPAIQWMRRSFVGLFASQRTKTTRD